MERIEGQAAITSVIDHLEAISQQITMLQYLPAVHGPDAAVQGPDAIVQSIRDIGV